MTIQIIHEKMKRRPEKKKVLFLCMTGWIAVQFLFSLKETACSLSSLTAIRTKQDEYYQERRGGGGYLQRRRHRITHGLGIIGSQRLMGYPPMMPKKWRHFSDVTTPCGLAIPLAVKILPRCLTSSTGSRRRTLLLHPHHRIWFISRNLL